MRYRLGIDVGSNSLGWCVLELDEDGEPFRIEGAGSRIFSDGRDVKSKATLKAERRTARSARRRHDRYKQRRTYLISELTKLGLFPESKSERLAIQGLNPFELRAKALAEKIPLHHIGRALFHINQRRGFKSNRKDRSEESSSGMVSNSVRALLEEMNLIGENPTEGENYRNLSKEEKRAARQKEAENRKQALVKLAESNTTFGEFLWKRNKKGTAVRARPLSDAKLYDVYPTREILEDEFNKIWRSQKQYYPEILTDKNFDKIKNIIFYQRKLKPPAVGHCIYFAVKYYGLFCATNCVEDLNLSPPALLYSIRQGMQSASQRTEIFWPFAGRHRGVADVSVS